MANAASQPACGILPQVLFALFLMILKPLAHRGLSRDDPQRLLDKAKRNQPNEFPVLFSMFQVQVPVLDNGFRGSPGERVT